MRGTPISTIRTASKPALHCSRTKARSAARLDFSLPGSRSERSVVIRNTNMLNSFSKFFLKIFLITIVLGCVSHPSFAADWTVAPGVISESEYLRLKERHKAINSPYQLQLLLTDFGRRFPTFLLEAKYENQAWVLYGQRATIISDIKLNIATRLLRIPLYASIQSYIGEVDSDEVQNKIRTTAKNYLRNRGFPLATFNLKREQTKEGTLYNVTIDEKDPCLIENVEIGFSVPSDMSIDLEQGDICDKEEIEDAIVKLETKFRDKGFNQLKIELAEISINDATNYATVYISGVLGQRVKYQINDISKMNFVSIFQDDELTDVDPSIVGPEAMTAELERRYKSHGYLDVSVAAPQIEKSDTDEFIYTYNVTPGTQYILSSLQFEGVSIFSNEEVLDIMGLSSLWQSARPLNMNEIESGLASLRVAYQERGYWDAQVRDPGGGQRNKETGTVKFIINIKEGLPRIINRVSIEGNKFFDSNFLRDLFVPQKDDAIDRAMLVEFDRDIRAEYLAKGYLYSQVKITLQAFKDARQIPTNILVVIDEGPRVKIGDIAIVGIVKTKNKVVKRELLFKTGDWYSPEDIAISRRDLTRLGIFSSVKISPADRQAMGNQENELNMTVEIREGKPGAVTFGPGWNLISGFVYGAEASYANIGGVGRRLSIQGAISEEKHQPAIGPRTLLGRNVGVGFLEPYVFDSPISSGISARHKAEAFNDYWKLSNEGEINFSYKLKKLLPGSTLSTFYGQEVARTEGGFLSEDNLASLALVRIGQVGIRYSLDETNSKEFPSEGFTLNLEYAYANYNLGGNLRFNRFEFKNNYFFGIIERLVFAVSFGVTTYNDVETESDSAPDVLPTSERLQLGGMAASVRGYRPLKIGPAARVPTFENNAWNCGHKFVDIGGSNRTILNTELRYKITDSFASTAFIDSGSTFFSNKQVNQFKLAFNEEFEGPEGSACDGKSTKRSLEYNRGYSYSDLAKNPDYFWSQHYLSYGTAFNILTPIGSLNLAYGLPLKQPKSKECSADASYCYDHGINSSSYWLFRGNFHFSVGAKF